MLSVGRSWAIRYDRFRHKVSQNLMSTDFRDWYERVYPHLSGHGLWLRGGEPHTLPTEQYSRRPFRVLFARLSTYHDTAESFTHAMLYAIARSIAGVFPDLAY